MSDIPSFETLFYGVPRVAGSWEICGSLNIYVANRPNWLWRKMARALLGWKWRDA